MEENRSDVSEIFGWYKEDQSVVERLLEKSVDIYKYEIYIYINKLGYI